MPHHSRERRVRKSFGKGNQGEFGASIVRLQLERSDLIPDSKAQRIEMADRAISRVVDECGYQEANLRFLPDENEESEDSDEEKEEDHLRMIEDMYIDGLDDDDEFHMP